jgi:dipeptidyl aminopeptidase/acylaminoacyl peptidase
MAELYVSRLSPFPPKKLTDFTAQVKDWTRGTSEVISWKSQDGAEIEGIPRKPAGYDPSRKYPPLVHIHGGPTGTSEPTLSPVSYAYPIQQFLANGALVLEPNYRGSAGYGAKFRALNVRNLGVGDMWDVMSGVDYLIGKSMVDPSQPHGLDELVGRRIHLDFLDHAHRSLQSNIRGRRHQRLDDVSRDTDITPFTRQYLDATPWQDPEVYEKTSPISTIKQAKTPTLIQQGSNDKRVPVPDSYELYRGLQDQGVESRMVLYSGFGHDVDKPKSQKAPLQSNLDWFNHYLWNEPIPKDSPIYGTSELPTGK